MAAGGPTTDTAPQRRRAKAALFAVGCGWAGLAPHWLDPSLCLIPAITLAVVLGGYSVRSVLLPALRPASVPPVPVPPAPDPWPAVDVVVAARDEEAVIGRLVERVSQVRYPAGLLTLWVVDDASSDRTPAVLAELKGRFP